MFHKTVETTVTIFINKISWSFLFCSLQQQRVAQQKFKAWQQNRNFIQIFNTPSRGILGFFNMEVEQIDDNTGSCMLRSVCDIFSRNSISRIRKEGWFQGDGCRLMPNMRLHSTDGALHGCVTVWLSPLEKKPRRQTEFYGDYEK